MTMDFDYRKAQKKCNGYFSRVTDNNVYPAAVGLCGKLDIDTIKPDEINYIRLFYGFKNGFRLVRDCPEDLNVSCPAHRKNFPNGYIIFYP